MEQRYNSLLRVNYVKHSTKREIENVFLQKGNHRWDHIYAEKLGQNEIARRDEISFCTCYGIYGVPTECRRERKSLLSFMRLLLAESKVDFPLFIINLENLETIYSRYLYFFFFTDVFKKRRNSSSFPFLFSRFIELIKRRH